MITVNNVVVMSSLNVDIRLRELTYRLTHVQYKPNKFSSIIWKPKGVGGNCLLFRNGKMICQGSKTYRQARKRVRQYARIIQKLGYNVTLDPIRMVTATAVADLGAPVNLVHISKYLSDYPDFRYEPELFNALMFKTEGVHFSVFTSGKITLTGITSIRLIRTVIRPMLLQLAIL